MSGYARAFVKRVTRGQAITEANKLVVTRAAANRSWVDGFCSLVPRAEIVSEEIVAADWVVFEVWVPASMERLDPLRAEWLWRMLSVCRKRFVLELSGQELWIRLSLRCHRIDSSTVREQFAAAYPDCALNETAARWWRLGTARYAEVESPWTPARLTRPEECPDSVLWAVVEWLLSICGETVGFFHVVFEPATLTDTFHQEIELQHDLSFLARLISADIGFRGMGQQVPSGDLRQRSDELNKKASRVLPFFGVALR